MLIVETIAKIRRAYFVQQKPIKVICRELGLSRKVVRKVIRSEATEFCYTRTNQPLPKIAPWREELDALLLANEGKAPRERLTLVRLFEMLTFPRKNGHRAMRLVARPALGFCNQGLSGAACDCNSLRWRRTGPVWPPRVWDIADDGQFLI